MKHKVSIPALLLFFTFFSCKEKLAKVQTYHSFTSEDTAAMENSARILEHMIYPVVDTPIWGYRFIIDGDFDGDGVKEVLTERYYSLRDKQETSKFFSGEEDIYDLDRIASEKEVISFMSCSNPEIDTPPIGGVTGPLFVKNEGDLDKDGGDEISSVSSLPQMSSMNHCHIISYKKGKWVELLSFGIREWELPPLPQAGRMMGLFGMDGFYNVAGNDSLNHIIEDSMKRFNYLVQPLKNGRVRIETWTEVAEDSFAIVDFKKIARKFK